MNNRAIKFSENMIHEASIYAPVFSRSIPKQIEHWAKIGKIAEENPDLSYEFIKDIMLSLEESKSESPTKYVFG